MSIEDSIFAALTDLVDGRVERVVALTPPARPYIVFQQVGGEPYDYLESQVAAQDNGRFQVSVWADDVDEALELGRTVRRTLVESTTLRAQTLTGMTSVYEPDTQLYGTRQDFGLNFT